MLKSSWTSWAPVPNKPTVSVDVKQHFSNNLSLGNRGVLLPYESESDDE